MIGDPLSRSKQVWSKLIAWTFAVMALTGLVIWGLAPVKSSHLADWPRILWSSCFYCVRWWHYLIQTGSLDAFRDVGCTAGGRRHDVGDRLDRGLDTACITLLGVPERRVMAGEQARVRVIGRQQGRRR